MADSPLRDMIGDLRHHPIDTVTGWLKDATAPNKPAATVSDASHHVAGGYTSGRQAQIDKQVAEDGG